jgi:formylglycine-generating enzyme required for sulfatase activity
VDAGGTVTPDAASACAPVSPDGTVSAAGLQGWWDFDRDLQDGSGNANHCVARGNASRVQDAQRGMVLSLDGTGDYLDCGASASLTPSQAVTVSLWVRVRSFGVRYQAFFARNGEQCGWTMRRAGDGSGADFVLRGTAGVDDLMGSRSLHDGAWHHLAGVFGNGTRRLYVDGELDNEVQDSGSILACPADHVLVGAMGAESFGYGHDAHDGWLDDVRLYSRALDAREVRVLAGQGQTANSPSPGNGANCVDSNVVLTWEAGTGACAHHVYFGRDAALVAAATDPGTAPGRGVFHQESFSPGLLDFYTTYHWRVDEVTAEGVKRGPAWSFRTCGEQDNGFVRIPAGQFTMGNSAGDTEGCRSNCGWPFDIEKPHDVVISRDFWMKATEVTRGEWAEVAGAAPASVFAACGSNCPVENVTWWQMVAYCNLRSNREGLTPCYYKDAAGTQPYDMAAANSRAYPHWVQGPACQGFRMPTEAEWEYAARAGTTTPNFLGAASNANIQQAGWIGLNSACSYAGCEQDNCRSGAGNIPPSGIHPVGQKLANPWGLYDTAGNVWEFVWDFFGEYHDGPVTDPTGPVAHAAGFHVARGGSWLNGRLEARVSSRDGDDCTCDPDNGPGSHTGFRIARTAAR